MPKSAAAHGMSFEDLCWRILETSIGRDIGPDIAEVRP
jgi:hypothetical protein